MKAFAIAAFFSTLIAVPAMAQPMSTPTSGVGPVCIHPFWTQQDTINHTHVLDPQHVLFYMRDGKVMLNTLKGPCPGLMFHGFSFVTPKDDILCEFDPHSGSRNPRSLCIGALHALCANISGSRSLDLDGISTLCHGGDLRERSLNRYRVARYGNHGWQEHFICILAPPRRARVRFSTS